MGICSCSDEGKGKKRIDEEKKKRQMELERLKEFEKETTNKKKGTEEHEKIKKDLDKKSLEKNKSNKVEYGEKNKIYEASIESKKIINGDFLYWSNNTKINSINDSRVDLDFKAIKNLKGILKLLFLRYLSKITKNEIIQKINNQKIIKVLRNLNRDLELINKKSCIENENYLEKDVQIILKEKEGNNIIEYAKYVDSIINSDEIEALINIHELEQKEKINKFLNKIIKYENYNTFFEEEFAKAQSESIFDYSIINIVLLDNKKFINYEKAKNSCPNCTTKLLFHGTQIDPASKIISSEFKYTRKAFYGMGIYFTDNLDYVTFYSGGDNIDDRREYFNKILSPNSTFTFIASEVFYNQKLLKHIRNQNYYVKELDHFPTYEEIKTKYKDKMIQKNGIHFITVKSEHGQVLKDSITSLEERKNGKFIVNEYVVTELDQICPLYAVKIQRNKFFILWRDSNFKGKNFYYEYLKERELDANGIDEMNIYIENNTEKALKFLYKRRFNKIILITSIGLDLSGKKFIEVARKILGSKIIVLIYSSNKKHLEWIQNYKNVLYTNTASIYKKYIKNYNEKGLNELKKEVEEYYNIKLLDFTDDFLSYPHYIENQKYSDINFSEKSSYIKQVTIYNKMENSALIMNNDGTFEMIKGKKENSIWDITLINDEITLFSNGYYLGYDKNLNKIVSNKYMERLNYINTTNDDYILIAKNDLLLSVNDNKIILVNKNIDNNDNYSIFQFIDVN